MSCIKMQQHLNSVKVKEESVALYSENNNQKTTENKFGESSRAPHFSKPNDGTNTIICDYCKKPGHKWRECRAKKDDDERKKRFATTNKSDQQVSFNHRMAKDNDKTKDSGEFVAKGKYGTFTSTEHSWVVDLGATSHMTAARSSFVDFVLFEELQPIILGDGKEIIALGQGKVPFRSTVCAKSERKSFLRRKMHRTRL